MLSQSACIAKNEIGTESSAKHFILVRELVQKTILRAPVRSLSVSSLIFSE